MVHFIMSVDLTVVNMLGLPAIKWIWYILLLAISPSLILLTGTFKTFLNIQYNNVVCNHIDEGGIPQRLEENPHGSIKIPMDFISTMWTLELLGTAQFMMDVSAFRTSLRGIFLGQTH